MESIPEPIRVMVRIRPPPSPVLFQNPDDENVLLCSEKKRSFVLNHIFNAKSSNQDVFNEVGPSMIQNVLNGYNSTLLVYGPTGTGKTHTMSGCVNDDGIIQRIIKSLKEKMEKGAQYENYSLKVSFIEIYNETVKDLLSKKNCDVRQDARKGFYAEGIYEVQISTYDEFQKIYQQGNLARQTGNTNMNKKSSRSHSILTVSVQFKLKSNQGLVKSPKMKFVDLAGTEKLQQNGKIQNRKSETININKSLQALRIVVSSLEDNKTKRNSNYVNYRGSILTQLLKNSLGGNSHTIFIGTINSKSQNMNDTIKTLEFLEGAKKIKNVKKVNENLDGNNNNLIQTINQLKEQIDRLKNDLQEAQNKLKQAKQLEEEHMYQINELENRIRQLDRRSLFNSLKEAEDYDFRMLQEPCQLSFKDGMSNIQETSEYSQIVTSKSKLQQNQPLDDYLIIPPSQQNKDISLNHLMKILYQHQLDLQKKRNQKLSNELQKYHEYVKNLNKNRENSQSDPNSLKTIGFYVEKLKNAEECLKEFKIMHNNMFQKIKQQLENNQAKRQKQIFENFKLQRQVHSQNSQSCKSIKQLKEQIQMIYYQSSQNISQLNETIFELKIERDDLKAQIAQLNFKVQDYQVQIKLQDQITKNQIRESYEKILLQNRREIQSLQRQNNVLITYSRQQTRQQFNSYYVNQLRQIDSKNSQLHQQLNKCQQQRDTLIQQNSKNEQKIVQFKMECERLNIQLMKRQQHINQQIEYRRDLESYNFALQYKIKNLRQQFLKQKVVQFDGNEYNVQQIIQKCEELKKNNNSLKVYYHNMYCDVPTLKKEREQFFRQALCFKSLYQIDEQALNIQRSYHQQTKQQNEKMKYEIQNIRLTKEQNNKLKKENYELRQQIEQIKSNKLRLFDIKNKQ